MEWQADPDPKPTYSPMTRALILGLQSAAHWMTRHWLWVLNGFFALLVGGALLTPVLMQMGLTGPAKVMYTIYSFTCHQLPERSYFLFTPEGPITTYTLDEIVAQGANPATQLTLREFNGNPEFGWKAGFSDRMFSMYGGSLLGGLIYAGLSRRRPLNPLPWYLLLLLALPMAIDGTSHLMTDVGVQAARPGDTGLIADLAALRSTNEWARPIFGDQSEHFYTGTTTGSLNANLRLITGLMFGIGTILFAYPYLGWGFYDMQREDEERRLELQRRVEGPELTTSAAG